MLLLNDNVLFLFDLIEFFFVFWKWSFLCHSGSVLISVASQQRGDVYMGLELNFQPVSLWIPYGCATSCKTRALRGLHTECVFAAVCRRWAQIAVTISWPVQSETSHF